MALLAVCVAIAVVGGLLVAFVPQSGWAGHALFLGGFIGGLLALLRLIRGAAFRSVDRYVPPRNGGRNGASRK